MKKYRVELDDLNIKSIQETDQDVPESDRIPEEHTGEIMYVMMHAENEEEAREKAERLAGNLRGQRKVD